LICRSKWFLIDDIKGRCEVWKANMELQTQDKLWDKWVSFNNERVEASLLTVQQNRKR
jgi:hypothetical protein